MPSRLALPPTMGPLDFDMFTGLPVPDPITFVVSPKWCNRPQLYPRQATLLKVIFLRNDLLTEYDHAVIDEWEESFRKSGNNGITPGIRLRMASLALQGYSYFREVLLVLGRRAGKGYVSALAMSYVLWRFMAKGDPQGHYGIDRDKQLALFVYAGKKQQARENLWKDLVNVVQGAPCFTKYISRPLGENLTVFAPYDFVRLKELRRRGISTERDMATFTIQPKEATLMSARGPASCVLAFDEMAHVVATGANRSAEQVYSSATPSLDQFKLDGFIIDPSSPWQQVGQFYANWQMSLAVDEDGEPEHPYMMMLQLASWEIYYDWEAAHQLPVFPEGFAGDLDEYLDAPHPSFPPLKGAVQEFDERMEKLERANPDTFAVERRSRWQAVVDAYLDPKKVDAIFKPDLAMRSEAENLTTRYAGHADPSKVNDNFGVAIGHTVPIDDGSGLMKVRFDFIHHWMPSEFPENTIDYLEVTDRLWDTIWAFKVDEFTFDQHNCLAADTLVPTADGLLTLQELIDPDGKMAVGELRPVEREVQARETTAFTGGSYRKGVAATRKIRTKMGYLIEATPEHRVWVRKAKEKAWHPDREWEWLPASEIEAGDWVSVRRNNILATKEVDIAFARPTKQGATSRHWGVFRKSPTRWEAYGRKDGQRVPLGYFATEAAAAWRRDNPTSHRLTRYPEVCTPELALVMGYLVSEGDVSAKSARFGNKDREVLASYGNALSASFGGTWDYAYTDNWRGKYSYGWIRAGGHLGRFFTELGIGGRSQEKTVPSVIRRSPAPVAAAFLRGLFEGDGGVTISRQDYEEVAFHTTSERLAHEVQQLLLALGVFSTNWSGMYTYKGEKRPYWRLKVLGPDIVDFAERVGFDCSRKQGKLAEAVARVLARGDKAGLRRKNCLHGDELWMRVASIEESEAECYDLSVPGPENFVSNGVIAHNSAMPIATLVRKVRQHRAPKRMDIHEETATSQHNWQVAECFKVAINQGWVEAPEYETAQLELKFLQLKTTATTNRVVHQDTGPVVHDDVAKCLMEVTWRLLADQVQAWSRGMLEELKPVFGQQGGMNPYGRLEAPDQSVINQLSPAMRNMVRGGGLNPARNPHRRRR